MREWLTRLLDWFRRDRLDAELTEELRFHQSLLERDTPRGGSHARDDAARRLGNITRVREEARERWSVPWLDHVQQDIRYAIRGLRRSPAFYLDLRRWATSTIEASAAYANMTLAVGTGDDARERPISAVSASLFDFFNARPVAGRFFAEAEDQTPVGASVSVWLHEGRRRERTEDRGREREHGAHALAERGCDRAMHACRS